MPWCHMFWPFLNESQNTLIYLYTCFSVIQLQMDVNIRCKRGRGALLSLKKNSPMYFTGIPFQHNSSFYAMLESYKKILFRIV